MIYISDIIFSAVTAAFLTITIETIRLARSYNRIPVLTTQDDEQRFEYRITCEEYEYIGYSNTEYTPAELMIFAVNQLGLTGTILISMSERTQ